MKTHRLILTALLGVMACSVEKEKSSRLPYESIQLPNPNDADVYAMGTSFVFSDGILEPDACSFLNNRRLENIENSGTVASPAVFQLYESIHTDENQRLWGAHAVSKLPQVLFLLSKEGSEDWGPLYRSYDIWSFYRLAQKEICPQIPEYCEVLKQKDKNYEDRHAKEIEIQNIEDEIGKSQYEFNAAKSSRNSEGISAAATDIANMRKQIRAIKREIKDFHEKAKILDNRLKARARDIRRTKDNSKIVPLKKIRDLLDAIENWDGMTSKVYQHFFLSARNEEIEALVNRRIPGALDGQTGVLGDSDLFKMFLQYLASAFPGQSKWALSKILSNSLSQTRPVLTGNYALFDGEKLPTSWVKFDRDIASALALLAQPATDIQDTTCKFVIAQRLMAQIISMKGIRQSPVLTAEGTLPRLETDLSHQVPHEDVPGIYDLVVDEPWIQTITVSNQVDIALPEGTIDPLTGTVLPLQHFAYVRAMARIAQSANAMFWVKNKFNLSPEELIPMDLLKLSFGMMAAGLKGLQAHFLLIYRDRAIVEILPNDSAEGFLSLLSTVVKSLQAFDEVYRMSMENPALAFLNFDQLAALRKDGDIKTEMSSLLYITAKGAIKFYKDPLTDPTTKEDLKQSLRNTGAYLKNNALYNFDSKSDESTKTR